MALFERADRVRERAVASPPSAPLLLIAGLLVLTAAFGKDFSTIGAGGVYVTEAALLLAAGLLVLRCGAPAIAADVGAVAGRVPVALLLAFWFAGLVAALRGLAEFGLGLTLEDIGLAEYSIVLPLVIAIAATARDRAMLVRALALGGLAAGLVFAATYAASHLSVALPLDWIGGVSSAFGLTLYVLWAAGRVVAGRRPARVHAVLVPAALALIALTGSRAGLLALLAGLLVVAAAAPGWRRRAVAGLAAGALTAFALLAGLAIERVLGPPPGSMAAATQSAADQDAAQRAAEEEASALAAAFEAQQRAEALRMQAAAAGAEIRVARDGAVPGAGSASREEVPAADAVAARREARAEAEAALARAESLSAEAESAGSRKQAPPVEAAIERDLAGIAPSGGAGSGEQANVHWRLHMWGALLDQWRGSPLLGVGFGKPAQVSWQGVRYDHRERDPAQPFDVTGPHNDFVMVLHRMGAIGIVALLGLVAVAAWRTRDLFARGDRRDRRAVARRATLAGMLAAAVVVCGFNDALKGPYLGIFLWVILGLLLVEARPRERQAEATRVRPSLG